MLKRCVLALLVVPLLACPAHAEDITLSVHGNTAAGTLPIHFGAGTVRRHGVRGVRDGGERHDRAVSVRRF